MNDDFEDRLRAGLYGLADQAEASPWLWSRVEARLRAPTRRSPALLVTYSLAITMACLTALEFTVFQLGITGERRPDGSARRSVLAVRAPTPTTLFVPAPPPDALLRPFSRDSPRTGAGGAEPAQGKVSETSSGRHQSSTSELPPPSTSSPPQASTTRPLIPSAPRDVLAVAGDASATVSWQPPTSAGSSEITAYIIHGGQDPIFVPGDQLSVTVEGLTNGRTYVFTVKARSATGDSPESPPSSPITPTKESHRGDGGDTEERDHGKDGSGKLDEV